MPISVLDFYRYSTSGGLGGAGGGVTLSQVQNEASTAATALKTELADSATAGKGANLIAYTKMAGETGVVAPQYPVGDIRRYGARGDGTSRPLSTIYGTLGAAQAVYPHAKSLTDELDWAAIQAAIENASARSLAGNQVRVTVPSGHYTINNPVRMRHHVALIGEGSPIVENIYTGTHPVTQLCLMMGNFHPAHYVTLASKTYALENIAEGARTITFTTPAEAGNLAVGIPFVIRSTGTHTTGANQTPVFHESNIPLAINVASGVVTLKYAIEEYIAGAQAVQMNGSVNDDIGEPIYLVRNISIDGIAFKSNANQLHQWCSRWGTIEATVSRINVLNSRNLVFGNMFCRSIMRGITGQFSNRAIEIKSAATHSFFTDIIATYVPNGSPVNGEALLSFGESAHNLVLKNIQINAGGWTNEAAIQLGGCAYRIVVDDLYLSAPGASTSFVSIQSISETANLSDIIFRNITCYGGATISRWMTIGSSGLTGTIPKRFVFQNARFFGTPTVTTASAILFNEGENFDFHNCIFENGRMGVQNNTKRFRFMNCEFLNRQAGISATNYTNHIWRGNRLTEWSSSNRISQVALAVNSTTANNVVATYLHSVGARPEDQDCLLFSIEVNANGTAGAKTIEIRDDTGALVSVSIASGTTGIHRINGQIMFRSNAVYSSAFTVVKPDGSIQTARVLRTGLNVLSAGRTFTVQGWVENAADSIDFDSISIMPVPLLGGMPI